MKQLLIVNSTKAYKAGVATGKDISGLQEGAIVFLDPTTDAILSTKPTKNFAIALGRANGQMPFMISEVDVKTLEVTKAVPQSGVAMSSVITLAATTKEVGFMIVKKGAVPHERNTNTFTIMGTGTAATDATKLYTEFQNRNKVMALPFTASVSGAAITITAQNSDEMYTVVAIGDATAVEANPAVVATGDKAYIQNLASMCAAGKGFTDTLEDGATTIPGYPENVEDTTYNVYTLRFAVSRASAKTRDEVVNQLVHIAVPVGATALTDIETILGIE